MEPNPLADSGTISVDKWIEFEDDANDLTEKPALRPGEFYCPAPSGA